MKKNETHKLLEMKDRKKLTEARSIIEKAVNKARKNYYKNKTNNAEDILDRFVDLHDEIKVIRDFDDFEKEGEQ